MATRLPSGNYRTQVFTGYNKNGRRQYKSFTAETAKKADLAALQWQSAHPSDTISGLTVRKAVDDYIKLKAPVLSPSSIRQYRQLQRSLNEHYDRFMRKKLEDVRKVDLQKVINDLAGRLSPKTVRDYHGLLSAVFAENEVPFPSVTLPTKIRQKLNIPDEETLHRLFHAAEGTDLEVPILLGAIGPMRRGEIVGARLSDLEGNVLHIHRAVVRNAYDKEVAKEYPKTDGSNRIILLPQELADKIRAQGCVSKLNLSQITKKFHRLLKHEGIESFRFHDLRHAFVSIAHAAGLPDAYIQERGGWSTNYTMNNVYRHTLDSDRKKEQDKVNDVFEKLM